MKISRIISVIAVAAALTFASATTASAQSGIKSFLSGLGIGSSTATTSGKSAGAALKTLYTNYKTDGKIDVSNVNNILQLATLAKNIQDLKGQKIGSDYFTDFASGLVSGSSSTITSAASSAVTSALSSLASNSSLSSLTSVASSAAAKSSEAIENAKSAASSVSNIFSLFSSK